MMKEKQKKCTKKFGDIKKVRTFAAIINKKIVKK
jgi:hypothetical protein